LSLPIILLHDPIKTFKPRRKT